MIYVLSLLACLFCSVYYDILNRTINRRKAYYCLLLWFIVVSGLQYMVGTDIPVYVKEYQELSLRNLTWKSIIDYNVRYKPGWMILCYACRFITKNYVLLKCIQAVFLNIAIFSFFKKHSKYVFTAVLLYAVSDYLVLNFNVMRHSFAVGFSLYAITAMKDSSWRKFAFYVFMAYMFHNSAVLLLIFPVIKFFKPNKFSIGCIILLFIGFIYAIAKLDLTMLFQEILSLGYMDESIAEIGQGYMNGDRLGAQDSFAIFSLTRMIYFAAVIYYLIKYKDPFWSLFGVAYIIIHIVTGFMPILWRYRLYVDIPFFIILSQIIVELPKQKRFAWNTKMLATSILLVLTIYLSMKDLFVKGPGEKYAAIDQYHPYHSVFNPKINREQLDYFDSIGY